MAARIVNLAEWRAHLLDRLNRDIESTADPELIALRDVTLAELAIESFYPADAPTAAFLRGFQPSGRWPDD